MLFEQHFAAKHRSIPHFRRVQCADGNRQHYPNIENLLTIAEPPYTPAQLRQLRRYYYQVAKPLGRARKAIDLTSQAASALSHHSRAARTAPENPRATFIHSRGEFLQPKEKVEPGSFSFLPALHRMARFTIAWPLRAWLVDRDQPLTARVTVNRQWAAFFGRPAWCGPQRISGIGRIPGNAS